MFSIGKTRMLVLTCWCWWRMYDDMLSRFDIIPERDGQTDRQTDRRTDRIPLSISRVSTAMILITVNLYSAFCKKKPKRAACASLVERDDKGFEVALKR